MEQFRPMTSSSKRVHGMRPVLILITLVLNLTLARAELLPGQKAVKKPHVVFLISEDSLNYEAHLTMPVFAKMLEKKGKYKVTVLKGKGPNNAFSFPGLEILKKADLVVLFSRRIALPHKEMKILKDYLGQGGPLVAIRTGNHAFTTRGTVGEDYQSWPEFVPEILGCGNRGYGPVALGTDVSVAPESANHPILSGFKPTQFHSVGNIYYVTPLLDKETNVLLNGKAGNEVEPVAWTRNAGKSRVFYTTLGYPTDFLEPQFNNLLMGAIQWAIGK